MDASYWYLYFTSLKNTNMKKEQSTKKLQLNKQAVATLQQQVVSHNGTGGGPIWIPLISISCICPPESVATNCI
jgi:hypothetical protein